MRFPLSYRWGICTIALFGLALSLLTIGIKDEWRLLHEEDAATYTAIALSHNYLGFRGTKFHDVFFDRNAHVKYNYCHHPPLASILLALTFRLTGSDAPWAVRSLPIAFQLLNLGLLLYAFSRRYDYSDVLVAGFIWIVIPMESFFGRIFTQSVIASLPVMMQFVAYYRYKTTFEKRWAILFYMTIIFGALVDWSPLFVSIGYGVVELVEWVRTRQNTRFIIGFFAVGVFITAFNLAHLYYASAGDMSLFSEAFEKNLHNQKFTFVAFVGTVLDFYRRYFTHVGFISSGLVVWALLFRRGALHAALFEPLNDAPLERAMSASLLGAALHIIASPSYSKVHHYWYFYFMPFAVSSIFVVWLYMRRHIHRRSVRILVPIMLLEFVIMSGYMLHIRHQRCLNYTRDKIAFMRGNYLLPCYLFHRAHNHDNLVAINGPYPPTK